MRRGKLYAKLQVLVYDMFPLKEEYAGKRGVECGHQSRAVYTCMGPPIRIRAVKAGVCGVCVSRFGLACMVLGW